MKDENLGNSIARGTMIILLVSILAKLASLIVESVLASKLGTTNTSDAYYMVASVQALIYPMLSIGVWKIFLPLYKERETHNNMESANTLANQVITFFTLISIVVVLLLILFSEQVVSLVAPGFDAETKELCARLVRISSPMYVFIIAAAVYASMLQSHGKFFGSQIREVASHATTIIAVVFFYSRFGIDALAYALIASGLVRLLIELPYVDWGYRYKPDFNFRSPDLKLMLKRMPSALITEGVNKLNTLVDKMMASSLAAGTVSALHYGGKLNNVFSGLISTAVSTALYPQMIALIARKKTDQLKKLIMKIFGIYNVLIIPITMACILFREELVTVVYARGSFTQDSIDITAAIFGCYCLYLLSSACNSVLSNLLYGYGNTRAPMLVSIFHLILNVILNITLMPVYGAIGLALATSLSSIFNLMLWLLLVRKHIMLDYRGLVLSFLRIAGISLVACIIPWFITKWLFHNVYLILISAAVMGIIIYLGLIHLFKMQELHDVVEIIRRRFQKKEE